MKQNIKIVVMDLAISNVMQKSNTFVLLKEEMGKDLMEELSLTGGSRRLMSIVLVVYYFRSYL